MHTETWYQWKELVVDDDGRLRYITPWSDPMQYEYPMDFLFESPQDAHDHLLETLDESQMPEPGKWVLVKVTYEPVSVEVPDGA